MKILAATLLLALVPAPAFAGDHDGGKMDCPMHDPAATDADRAKHLDDMFAKLDADASGAIDRAEFTRHHEDMRRKHAEQGDAAGKSDEHAAHH